MAKNPSFEDRLQRLEKIVSELESDDLDLDRAVSRYQDGMKLLSELEKHLSSLEEKIETLAENGQTRPFDVPGGDEGASS